MPRIPVCGVRICILTDLLNQMIVCVLAKFYKWGATSIDLEAIECIRNCDEWRISYS